MTTPQHKQSLAAFTHQSLAVVELDSLPRAVACQDALLKRANVCILACAPTSSGKVVLLYAGPIADMAETTAVVDEIGGSGIIDQLLLPHVHPDVLYGLEGQRRATQGSALGVFELPTVASLINAADAALKHCAVNLADMHAATGYAGKCYFTLKGDQADVEEAVEVIAERVGTAFADSTVIAAPHDDLEDGLLKRPWPLDPCR